jgi:RNA polymerase sigma-70 factor (ECF subfamily)
LVYVVDDDLSAREGVAGLIRSAGLMAKTFESGEEFLAASRPKIARSKERACQSAYDARIAILHRLADLRWESRFTTWACKFALVEAGAKVRRHAGRGREIPLTAESLSADADNAPLPDAHAEAQMLLIAVREEVKQQLTARQREVFVAVALNDVPIDVVADRLNTTRGAVYKT